MDVEIVRAQASIVFLWRVKCLVSPRVRIIGVSVCWLMQRTLGKYRGHILSAIRIRLSFMDPTARILRLLSLLQTYRHWPGEELSDRLGVSPRTVRRDVDRLRELGYPVDTSRGTGGGYQLAAGTRMPPLLLDDDEAVAIAVGLRTATGGGVTGIEETSVQALTKLPSSCCRRDCADGSTPCAPRPRHWSGVARPIDPDVLVAVAQACRAACCSGSGTPPSPPTDPGQPLRLVSRGRRWYLVACDLHLARHGGRFRVDRLTAPGFHGGRFPPRNCRRGRAHRSRRQASARCRSATRYSCLDASLMRSATGARRAHPVAVRRAHHERRTRWSGR